MFNGGIEGKILFRTTGTLVIALMVFAIFQISSEERQLELQHDTETSVLAETVVKSIHNVMLSGKGEFARPLIENLRDIKELSSVRLFDRDGIEHYSSPTDTFPVDVSLLTEVVSTGNRRMYVENRGGRTFVTHLHALPNEAACQACHPNSTRVQGVVLVSTSNDDLASLIRESRTRLALISLLSIVAAVVGVRFLIRRGVIQPLKQTMSVIKEIAEGDLNKTTHVTRDDEIGELALNVDIMAQNLRMSQERLHLTMKNW